MGRRRGTSAIALGLALALLVGLAGCGRDASGLLGHGPGGSHGGSGGSSRCPVGSHGSPDPGSSGAGSTIQLFTGVRPCPGDDRVAIGFTGPDPVGGSDCDETYAPEVRIDDTRNVVIITLNVMFPRADPTCAQVRREVVVDLGQPLAGRQIQDQWTGRRYQRIGDVFELVPESTPCGRADCSTPSPTPAPCETDAYRDAVDGIDGGISLGSYERCDGSFLVLAIDLGSSGCPPPEPTETSPCARIKLAYFVANNGAWRLVTFGSPEFTTCDDVAAETLIRFPDALCA
jgi:hypothetical protein